MFRVACFGKKINESRQGNLGSSCLKLNVGCVHWVSASRSTRGSGWFYNLGDLVAGSDDLLSLSILGELNIFVLPLSTLPDLYLASATDHTHTHSAQ